jgi:hypothetical protein
LTGHISDLIMYCRGTTEISQLKKDMIQLIHCLECWKDKELEVFWCGVKE